jgi:amino acid adenylation domain-containing protein
LFDEATIARMAGHFQTLLEAIAANPKQKISELPLLTPAEEQQLIVEWNNTWAEYPQDRCIHQLFEEQVERAPDAVAVVFEEEQLTYRELNYRANQLANYLRELGVGPEVLVGICVERSFDTIVGILGVLKAGGAYVPLDPTYPKERLAFMLEDSSVPVLLTQTQLVELLPQHRARVVCLDGDIEKIAAHSSDNLSSSVTPDNLAYIIYTSGSTGKPKGVLLAHSGLCNLATAQIQLFDVQPDSRILQFASFSFDASVSEIFMAIVSGATLVLAKQDSLMPGPALIGLLREEAITTVTLPPSVLAVLPPEEFPALQTIIVAGEACPPDLVKRWAKERQFFNAYGPTEATVCATVALCSDGSQKPPIGRPIANTQIYILDTQNQPVPIGVPGELHIAGAGLARGYLNRPELTEQKFIPSPFSDDKSDRLYKTGDFARYLPNGNIEYLGRIDNQVKVRGFRIELGEIEAALGQHPDVREVAVICREDTPGSKRLVAYVVPAGKRADTSSLRSFLKAKLPDYMIPAAFVMLDALPLTPNGKVDRRALPAPEKRSELEYPKVAPCTPIEEMLASIWGNILSIDSLGIHDNFFELGGHSLLATQVISRVRDILAVSLPLRSLFEAPTIAEFAERVENSLKNGQSIEALPLLPIPRSESIPLSFAQAGLWFLDQLQPESAFYNIPLALRLSGQLNIAALESSLNEIIRRHEALRTNFAMVGGQPVQVIASTLTLKLVQVDLRHLAESEREVEAQRLATVEAMLPFNLEREPLVRATVQQLDSDQHVLLLIMHHIISDGWSLGVFVREFAELYKAFSTGMAPVLPELSIQYADFAVWQRQWLTPEVVSAQLNYWKQQLLDAPALLELPADRPRPAVQTFQGAYHSFSLSLELSVALAALGKRAGVTLFMTLLAAFQTLLYRLSGQEDIVVGTPVAGRNRKEIEGLIGFFVNTLVLRTDLGGHPSFEELLGRVREVALGAYAHQDLPFEQLVEALQPMRDLSYTPLFQVMFALDDALVPAVELPDVTVSPLAVETGTAKFDLTLSMENTASGLMGEWEYNTDLFDEATIARMAGHFQTLLEAIAAHPKQKISELPLLTPAERQQLIVEWNNTWAEYPQDRCIHQLFEEQVERAPDAVAVVFEEEQLTYRELNARANQLAHYLQSLGVGPEVLVGLCVERSFDTIVGILGVLKAGGAYVPLDPAYPQERLAFMLEDSSVPVLLTQEKLVEKLPQNSAQVVCLDGDIEKIAAHSSDNLSSSVTPDNLAYIIYTSGSTGKPKGVLLAHKGLCNLATAQIQLFGVQPDSRILQFASFSFDVATSDVVITLSSGATLYLATKDSILPGAGLIEVLRDKAITHADLPVSVLSMLPFEELPALRTIVVGGEPCPPELVARWAPGRQFFNAYGPTEATVSATVALCNDGNQKPPIGRPIANTQVYILDTHNQPVPIGVSGELHIGGAGLAKGYLNRPDLTCSKFIPNPFSDEPGSRLYKTGDLARYLPDSNIEYLGRTDNQVKIRGFRIELGEIEAALGQHPDVREVAVICREDTPGNKRLVAYVVSNLIPERIPYHSECQLELDGNVITLQTEDISTGGVGLVGVPTLCEGSRVRLHLQLPGEAEPRWLSGTVAWSHPPQAGVRFNLTPSEQALVGQSVAHQLDTQELWKTLQRMLSGSLRDYLKQKLPDYMIPNAFVLIKALPLTPNGKVDRRALPAPDSFHNHQEDKFVAPRTPTEAKLAAIWAEVLGLKQVGINDNFFELGGHSLLATQIISRIRQAFAIGLPLRHLFEAPTIASLSELIETALDTEDQELFSYGAESDSQKPPAPATREGHIPLSLSQEYIWYVQQLNPESCGCNSGVALRFTEKLSPEVLDRSINEIIRRHEILRTTFPVVAGQPVQAIAPELTLPLKIVNLQDLPTAERETEALRISQLQMSSHFDLANGPLIKATLLQLSSEEHWLLIPMHHIITDGWSVGIFLQELETLYSAFSLGLPSPLPSVPLQYADFTIWQRQQFNKEVLAQQLSYWLQKLATPEQPQEYLPPQDSKSNSISRRAASYSLVLGKDIVASLEALSHSQNVTVPTILIAALKLLLFKWSGQSEILIGATIGNRSTPEIEQMLGCFINDVILLSHLDDEQTGVALLEQVKETLNEAISNKEIPFQQVIEAVKRQRKLSLSASVTIVPPVQGSDRMLGWDFAPVPPKDELWDEEIPLELYISASSGKSKSLDLEVIYSTDLFNRVTIERLFSSYHDFLQKLASSPEMKLAAFQRFQKNNREGTE